MFMCVCVCGHEFDNLLWCIGVGYHWLNLILIYDGILYRIENEIQRSPWCWGRLFPLIINKCTFICTQYTRLYRLFLDSLFICSHIFLLSHPAKTESPLCDIQPCTTTTTKEVSNFIRCFFFHSCVRLLHEIFFDVGCARKFTFIRTLNVSHERSNIFMNACCIRVSKFNWIGKFTKRIGREMASSEYI